MPGIAVLCPPDFNSLLDDSGIYECAPANAKAAVSMVIAEIAATFVLTALIL